MNEKKRTMALAGVLLALVAYAVPNVILKDSGNVSSNIDTSKSAADSKKSAVGNNKASANKNDKKSKSGISKDKLEIDNLTKNTYSLKSTEISTSTNPFLSIADSTKAIQDKEKAEKDKQKNVKLPQTVGVGGEHITNNVIATPAMQKFEAPQAPAGDFKLKAIAQTNDKVIAVVETGGKRTTAFIGTTIGDYTVTDIDSQHVYMQSDNGFTKTLDLMK